MTGLVEAVAVARSHTAQTWAHRMRAERDALAVELAVWTHGYAGPGNGLPCPVCGSGPDARVHVTPDVVRAATGPLRAGSRG